MPRLVTHILLAMGLGLAPMACSKSSDSPSSGGGQGARADKDESGPQTDKALLPKAEVLLDKAVQAVGGHDKLDAVDSYYYKGAIEILGQNIGGNIQIWWKDGDFYTTQEMVGIGQIRAGKQGDTIWSQDPINGLRKLEGDEAEQHMWASSLMLAADWKRYFSQAETVAERLEGGKKVYDVELTSDSGAKVTLSFDAESGLQLGQKFEQVTPMGKMPVSVEIEDYREVDGIKIPFKQITDASLAKATQEITEVEFNPEVDTSTFAMPTGGAEVVREQDLEPGKPVP